MFWHSVIVTLGEVFSAAHRGLETCSRGCQLRLTFTLHPAIFPSGLHFYVVHRTLSEKQLLWNGVHLIFGGIAILNFDEAKFQWKMASRSNVFSASPLIQPHIDLHGGRLKHTHFTYNHRSALQLRVLVITPHHQHGHTHENPPVGQCGVDHEVVRKELGLVCNFTSRAGWWWECPSWSQRSNLP